MKERLILPDIRLRVDSKGLSYNEFKNKKELKSKLELFYNMSDYVKVREKSLEKIDFKFDKNEGIFFETTYPIKSTTSYSNKDNQQINDIILAISNKKYSKLDKMFDFYYEKKGLIWTWGLKPK